MAEPGPYEKWFQSPGFGPNWMHDPIGNAYWASVGKVLDGQISRWKTALRIRYPLEAAALVAADALEQSGNDRLLPRGGTYPGANDEALATWAARQENVWETSKYYGTAIGILRELKVQGFNSGETGASIFNHLGRRYYLEDDELVITEPCAECPNRLDLSGSLPEPRLEGFTLSAYDQFYSRFCILFLSNEPYLDDYNLATSKGKAILNQTVQRYRHGGAKYMGATVVPVASGSWVLGWPATNTIGQEGLTIGANGARFISPE